jgi:preprotein translocase subunit YajC
MQNFALLILMFGAVGVMMVFGSRNKKKQAIKAKELQESILPGSTVMTTSGLHATVTAIGDDTIELEIAPGVYTTWVRAAVREVVVAAETDQAEFDESEFAESEFDESDYNELSGQDVEPIHDDHPSLEKRSNDVG